MSRQRNRMNRRAQSRQDPQPSPAQSHVFPRGTTPGNGAPQPQSRVAEVVDRRRTIPVEEAASPRPRVRPPKRTRLPPTDAVVASIQDGFARVEDRLVELITALRQAHGLDAADEELEQLRQANAQLANDAASAHQQLEQMRAVVGQQTQAQPAPMPQTQPQTVASRGPAQTPGPLPDAPPPTPPDSDPAQ